MADKKPTKRPGAPGGDRPMRRRAPSSDMTRDEARKTTGPRKPGFAKTAAEKPRGEKSGKPRGAVERPKRAARPAPAPVEKTSSFEGERIAKAMARAGVCSRREAEQWIAEGRVAVNGVVLPNAAFNVKEGDRITIDGAPMQERERTRLFLFHKPAGYVTTAHDPEGRPTVFAFLEERHGELPRVVSVGRLDINTEGLLLLTNDGGLARTLELPATGWTRRYRVRVHGDTDQAQLDELRKGVTIDGVVYAPIEARLERVQGANAWIAMSLTEGKNREIKRVMAHLGLDVTRLIRVSYGPFQLGELAEGAVEEVKLKILREQLGKSLAELAGVDFSSPVRERTATEEQEMRERAEKRPRKHVSVLRKQRDEKSGKGPRARIERGATADRKGRAVVVERVTPTARKAESETTTRNARRFEAMRGEGRRPGPEGGRAERPAREERGQRESFARGEGRRDERRAGDARRPPRFEEQRGERPARAPRERMGERRDERPRDAQRFERRPDDRAGGRSSGERANYRAGNRDETRYEKRPPRRDGDEARPASRAPRGAGAARDERPRKFDRPRGDREFSAADRKPGARKFDRPREAADARPPRAGGPSRGTRSGPGAGPGRGPRKGPPGGGRGGPGKGRPSGPRRPRGE
ncbi:pseudouridine synthase [Methylocystis sp. WRRC1]|uniref:pseudouridine synthase n=1 Tax=Methylocystis sp. WRRC1 TaxID=1732014 RepID=UPI001D154EB7|nr:pseudouridine synthase [Methylocystis sp. WRRC1]MCC3245699.1 pseudouridine synthase [Methylocystis sp. WRRC1]